MAVDDATFAPRSASTRALTTVVLTATDGAKLTSECSVNVTLTGATVPSVVSLDVSPTVTLAVGCDVSTIVNVAVPYPGASPDVVERELLDRLEESISGISGVDRISGTAQDGFANVTVFFVFEKPPLLFHPVEMKRLEQTAEYPALAKRYEDALAELA